MAELGPVDESLDALSRMGWERSQRFEGRLTTGATALSVDPMRGLLAVGSEQGVLLGRLDGSAPLRSVPLESVLDLHFATDGDLYIATAHGFWVLEKSEGGFARDPVESTPATGELARVVRRIATGTGVVAVATDEGVFLSTRPTHSPPFEKSARSDPSRIVWRNIDSGFPAGAVAAVAFESKPEVNVLWAVVGPALWRTETSREGRVNSVREEVVPGRLHGENPIDVVANLPSGSLALVYSRTILLRTPSAEGQPGQWKTLRPVLPPGATIRRLGTSPSGYWLATDRGLLLSRSASGRWRRAGSPAGRAAASAVAAFGTRLYVAGAQGLLVADRALGGSSATHRGRAPDAPPIALVHQAVLREQGLLPSVFQNAWRGVQRRAWLPALGLRFDADRDRGRATDHDEVFVSGEYHSLRDRDKDRSLDLGASLTMTWDLRDLAYEPEQIDISREARLVIGLRDDVLDEVNQIYFERLAVARQLEYLAEFPVSSRDESGDPNEGVVNAADRVLSLELRLGELTAGLDAWTGGWFSRQLEGARLRAN